MKVRYLLAPLLGALLVLALLPFAQAPAEAGIFDLPVDVQCSAGGTAKPMHQEVGLFGTATIYFYPDRGYHLAAIYDNRHQQSVSNPYRITKIMTSHRVNAVFAPNNYNVDAGTRGFGYVDPRHQVVTAGKGAMIRFYPYDGYHCESVIDNGVSKPFGGNFYITDEIYEDHEVIFTFGPNNYSVNASATGGHGSVSPTTQSVILNGTATIDIRPDSGYHVGSIIDNSASMPIADPYVIDHVRADHNVVVTFAPDQYTVNASVSGGHGSVDPLTQTVSHGGTGSISITPDTGYHVENISDNGEFKPVANPYVINGVTCNHDVVITFAINEYVIHASVPEGHGSVDPASQSIPYGGTVAIDIIPDAGYHLAIIVDNGESKTLADPYVIENVTQAHEVMVFFEIDAYNVNATVAGDHGSVSPATQAVDYGGTASINITPEAGYHITTITDNGTSMPISNPYVITNVSTDHDVIVTFAITDYMVAASVAGGHGSVSPSTQIIASGGSATITITPNLGYHIAAVLDNGISKTAASPYVINNVNEDHSVVASFALDQLTVTAQAYGNGSVSPASQSVSYGATASINMNADTGYHVLFILDNDRLISPGTNPYVINNVTQNHTVRVLFTINKYEVTAAVAGGHGSVNPSSQSVPYGSTARIDLVPDTGYHIASIVDNSASKTIADPYIISNISEAHDVVVSFALNQYDVSATAVGEGGSVLPPTQTVSYGGTASITISLEDGYHIEAIYDNGEPVSISSPYVISPATADHDVIVAFGLNDYTVSASVSGGHGLVDPASQQVAHGGTAVVDIVPDTGYYVSSILDNGESKTPSDPYIINDVTQAHAVVVTFSLLNRTIDASIPDGHGSVQPSSQSVSYGGTASVTISPDSGYEIASILDNDVPMIISNPYVITDVQVNHTVIVNLTHYESPTWYLAEGSTDHGFQTFVAIENAAPEVLSASLVYMTTNGAVLSQTVSLPALSQVTVNPVATVGVADFSTIVQCSEEKTITVERTMIWRGEGALSEEGHCSVGVTSPQTTWYLAEGSSAWNFETWTLIQNPNDQEAQVELTYMIQGSGPSSFAKTIAPASRASFNMADDIGAADASVKVASNVPIVTERSMYRNNRREGHNSTGAVEASTTYYLAEGTTAWGFTTYVLVQNPNSAPATLNLTCMTPSGPKVLDPFTMPANSRVTFNMNEMPALANTDFSTEISSDLPIIAERAMYWGEGKPLGEACHDAIGLPSPHMVFYMPDGQTSEGRETYTLVQNPNDAPAMVQVTYLRENGTGETSIFITIPPDSRITFDMSQCVANGKAAVMVASLAPGLKILAEQAVYWNSRGAGMDTTGGYSD